MKEQISMEELQMMLMRLLKHLENQIPFTEDDRILIMINLDTRDKMRSFLHWIRSKLDGDLLRSNRQEVVRAAVRIGHGRTDLP